MGYDIFNKSYDIMLRNDLHNINSIDYQFLKEMILVDSRSINLLYAKPSKVNHKITTHELFAFAQQYKAYTDKDTILEVLKYTFGIALNYNVEFLDMIFSGRELIY